MGVVTTGTSPKLLWPGLNSIWGLKYTEHPLECRDLFDQYSSNQAFEEDLQQTGLGLAPVKPEGSAVSYDTPAQGFISRYTHVTYGLGFIVSREEQEDNLYKKVAFQRTERLAFSMRQTEENVAANVYNRAFTSGFNFGDGTVLINDSHPTRSGNQSNVLSAAADLSEAALEDLLIQIMNTTDDLGLNISLMAQSLHIPPDLMFDAERILKSVLRVDSANNDINAMRNMGLIPGGAKVNHYFSDTDAWFLRTNCPDGMKYFNRRPTEFTEDNDFDTENHKYKSTGRYSYGATDWRQIFGTPGA